MAVPNIFANVTTSIPLSQLDANFATAITLGNTTLLLGNTTSTVGNLTLTGAAVNGTVGATTRAAGAFTTLSANAATTLSTTLGVTGAATLSGTLAVTGATTVTSTSAKTTASDIGGITIGSSDVSNPLQLVISLVGGASSAVRYAAFQSTEQGVSTNNIALNAGGGSVLVGCTTQAAAAKSTVQTATDNSRFMGFQSAAGAEIGYIFNNTTTTQYNTSSDYRLKDNVAPMIGALAKVAALKPVTYKWKSDGSDGQGFIAHELQEVVPDCVTGEKDATWEEEYEVTPAVPAVVDADGVEVTPAVEAVRGTRTVPSHQGVDTSFLVATLVSAIQELKAIIDAQATRIAALESV